MDKRFCMTLPRPIEEILEMLTASGFDGYLVGGCVRDAAMGKAPHDFDITTNALPEQTKAVFEKDFKVIETGIKHGTVTVLAHGEPIEITTFRIDGEYRDNRHPESVSFTSDITEDLARRDFTVNAMAFSPKKGFVDPFGGLDDISRRIIRCVGEPDKRFHEDGLRILRALRFAATLGFDIDEATAVSIHKNKDLLRGISAERIYTELVKLLSGDFAQGILRDFSDTFKVFAPNTDSSASANTVALLPKDKNLRLAAFLSLSGNENAEKFMQSMKTDTASRREVVQLVALLDGEIPDDRIAVKHFASENGIDVSLKFAELAKAAGKEIDFDTFCGVIRRISEEGQCISMKRLAVNGSELADVGIPAGKATGQVLSALLDMVIAEKIENEKSILLNEARIIAESLK